VEWLGNTQQSDDVPINTNKRSVIVSASDLDAAEVETIVKILGCITVQVARIYANDPTTTQSVAYFMGIGVFHADLSADDTPANEMEHPWMWTCSGRGVIGEESRGDLTTLNTHQYAGLVRWHDVQTNAMRKIPHEHGLFLALRAGQIVGTSTGIEATWNLRALCKR